MPVLQHGFADRLHGDAHASQSAMESGCRLLDVSARRTGARARLSGATARLAAATVAVGDATLPPTGTTALRSDKRRQRMTKCEIGRVGKRGTLVAGLDYLIAPPSSESPAPESGLGARPQLHLCSSNSSVRSTSHGNFGKTNSPLGSRWRIATTLPSSTVKVTTTSGNSLIRN